MTSEPQVGQRYNLSGKSLISVKRQRVRTRAVVKMWGSYRGKDDVCTVGTRYLPRFESAQELKLRFRALLTDGGTKRLELRMS